MLTKKNLIVSIIFIIFSCSSVAYDIDGEWEVDVEKTLAFNENNIKMASLRFSLMECSVKNTKLFFSEGRGALVIKDHSCQHKKKKTIIKGVFDEFNYFTIFESSEQLILKLKNKNKEENVEVINWIGSSSFWLDDGDQEEFFRHFYKKIMKPEK